MNQRRLLLLSNSTNPGEPYLGYALKDIRQFLNAGSWRTALFIPYAAVTFGYDEYEQKVAQSFEKAGCELVGIHRFDNPAEAICRAETIVVGGGNTWKLVKCLQDLRLMEHIRSKVLGGTPYIGWSAGSNLACPSLRTTNDMPIVQPADFSTLHLVPFQINPHYTDSHPEGLGGETREDRIREFIAVNPEITVAGLREGTMLHCEGERLSLKGKRAVRIFRSNDDPVELGEQDDLSFLLKPASDPRA